MKQAERYLNEGCHPRVLAEVGTFNGSPCSQMHALQCAVI